MYKKIKPFICLVNQITIQWKVSLGLAEREELQVSVHNNFKSHSH